VPKYLLPTSEDLAWAAGIIDGEGCVRVAKRVTKYRSKKDNHVKVGFRYDASLIIKMTCLVTIGKLAWILDQSHITYYDYHPGMRKPIYSVRLDCTKASNFLLSVLKYLVTKRKQAHVCIKLAEDVASKVSKTSRLSSKCLVYRETLFQETTKLNKVGVSK
jgi:hypothetical protein